MYHYPVEIAVPPKIGKFGDIDESVYAHIDRVVEGHSTGDAEYDTALIVVSMSIGYPRTTVSLTARDKQSQRSLPVGREAAPGALLGAPWDLVTASLKEALRKRYKHGIAALTVDRHTVVLKLLRDRDHPDESIVQICPREIFLTPALSPDLLTKISVIGKPDPGINDAVLIYAGLEDLYRFYPPMTAADLIIGSTIAAELGVADRIEDNHNLALVLIRKCNQAYFAIVEANLLRSHYPDVIEFLGFFGTNDEI